MRLNAQKIIATKGNQSVYPSGNAVFGPDGKPLVLPGQLVVFDMKKNESLGNTVTPAANQFITIGVGVAGKTGQTEYIRSLFGDMIWANGILSVTAEPPRCGIPKVIDLLYKCTDFDTDYSVTVKVENDTTQNQYPFGHDATFTNTVRTSLPPCDDCSSAHQALQLSCKLADAINEDGLLSAPTQTSTFYGNRVRERWYTAVPLYTQSDVYCLDLADNACETCTSVTNLKNITFQGESAVAFTNNVDPNDPTKTLAGQLQGIVDQINAAFEASTVARGHAVLTGGTGACCPFRLEINHCMAPGEVVIDDSADNPLTPCATFTPLAAVPVDSGCQDCPPVANNVTYTGGVRLISQPRPLPYRNDGFPAVDGPGYFDQDIQIFAGTGFEEVYYRTVQEVVSPENLGFQWHQREYFSDMTGGMGRGFDRFNSNTGKLYLPREKSPASNTIVDPLESYCSYHITHRNPFNTGSPGFGVQGARGTSTILIPKGDTTTQSDFEAIINNYITNLSLPFATVECSSDQDQDAAYASGTLTLTGLPVEDETVTIGSVTYTWKAAPAAANEVDIGGSASVSIDNLIAAINLSGTPGTEYGTGTVIHPTVSAAAGAGDTLVLTAKEAGAAGNDIATTETMTNGSFGAATLENGADSAIPEVYPNANGFVI